MPIYLFVCLSLYLSVCRSVCLSVYLLVCLPTVQQSSAVHCFTLCGFMNLVVYTVGYARTNVIVSRTSFVITSVRSSIHWNTYMHLGVIRSRPTAYSTVTIQSVPAPQPTSQLPSNPFQAHSLQHSYHPNRSRPTAYSTVTNKQANAGIMFVWSH